MESLKLLPGEMNFQVDHLEAHQDYLMGFLQSIAPSSACPLCGEESTKVQSHYLRKLADLPWAAIAVRLIVEVRRFCCLTSGCVRKIFTERLPQVVEPYRRRTLRMEKALTVIAQAEGGESGARTADELGMKVSPDTLLRQIRRAPPATVPTPQVLGVDDFSFRRGQRFGTILVDLEKHQRVDLLPERNAESFAAWLKAHPGVKIISRDRGQIYADGGRLGAPNALHVADRFHLIQNMREAVERTLSSHYQELQATVIAIAAETQLNKVVSQPQLTPVATENVVREPVRTRELAKESFVGETSMAQTDSLAVTKGANDNSLVAVNTLPNKGLTQAERIKQISAQKRDRRLARYQQIKSLSQQGLRSRAIARYLKISRSTVRRFLRADQFPERANPQRYSRLDRFIPYLKKRWEEGLHNSRKLWEEVKELGFGGSNSLIRRLVSRWRKQLPLYLQSRLAYGTNTAKAEVVIPSPRQVSFWLLGLSKEKVAEKHLHQQFVAKLCDICAQVAKAQALGIEFREMFSNRDAQALEPWLEKAKVSGLVDLKNFALGIERDKETVLNALKMVWSNGQVEGNNNRLKMIKRQMYGRAKFDLLRARVLHPT